MNWTTPLAFFLVFLATLFLIRTGDASRSYGYIDDALGFFLVAGFLGFIVTIVWWGVTV